MARFKQRYPTKNIGIDTPLYHQDHSRPVTRRELIRQGFLTGGATILSGGLLNMMASHGVARGAIAQDLQDLASSIDGCQLGSQTVNGNTPFICFDLAGGANIANSNALLGQAGGQEDFLSTAGYSKMGLPGDMIPGLPDAGFDLLNASDGDFINRELRLKFHADSALLNGILEKATVATRANIDGTIIAARSDNDTGNNPHNPLYGIAKAGARGSVVDLIGSRPSDSGGNSMAPASLIDLRFRPTKVDRPEDVLGLVDIGNLTQFLTQPSDVTAVMESMARLSDRKLQANQIETLLANNADIENLVRCGYIKAADTADYFGSFTGGVNPANDLDIQAIFPEGIMSDREFAKTASVMFMVMNGFAGGGCITMGGYDYHTGNRSTGENRDRRAGRCIGACLEYARRRNQNLMVYVFSDGSLASNGMRDDSPNDGNNLGGRGKNQWSGDNSSTASSMILVHNRDTGPTIIGNDDANRQIGWMTADGSVATTSSPAANNVNQLVNMVLLNYMALNGQSITDFTDEFPNHGLGNNPANYIVFNALDNS